MIKNVAFLKALRIQCTLEFVGILFQNIVSKNKSYNNIVLLNLGFM